MEKGTLICLIDLALLILGPTTLIWLSFRGSESLGGLFYLTPVKVARFKRNNPDLRIIASGPTKAIKLRSDQKPRAIGFGLRARRSVLILSTEGLHCGNLFLPVDLISNSTLIKAPTGNILKVSTSGERYYQFELKNDPAWEEQLVFPMKIEHAEIKLFIISLVYSLAFPAVLLWGAIRDFTQQNFGVATVLYIVLATFFSMPAIQIIKTLKEQRRANDQ